MSRSAADATRFTATGPYVGPKAPYKLPDLNKSKQKPPRPSNNTNEPQDPKQQGQQGQQGGQETPRQKVERLRAQARAARLSQKSSLVDRIIERGGRAANGAHKVIIYTLIAASGVCGALTIYSAVSLTMWNRRQRELWLDRQLQDLQSAREAYVAGTATPEQLEILRNEKIGEIEQQKIKETKEQRLWNRTKRFLFEGMKKEGASDDNKKIGVLEALNASKADEVAAAATSSTAVSKAVPEPGPLDVLAANAETSAKQSAKGWSDWIWRR
ncbi:uncharacterized protein TRUGW13939_09595 [Talaromyces rugulosus]|uniref:Cytochrome oxidase c assembly-domain-containing protein n=1 Tax=Talaromyces rugulosus TaxID=121627 RepID=A0A7H8R7R7_TALRU|nr:uncharacterized protein TRUGW13939_09595 [Talaromyces rugulosus]QKX62434.1 hypothetical protein TRUGW13939_09595 [Talaromyces rugulosus]